MPLATAEAIRDRILTLIEALTPTSLSADRFRRLRGEGDVDPVTWCEANPTAAFRRIWAREIGDDELPLVSDTTQERIILVVEIRICYPQTSRTGPENALDRDDVMNQDWKKINFAVGLYGRGNFSSTHDCTPLGCIRELERGEVVDFLLLTARYEYLRATA